MESNAEMMCETMQLRIESDKQNISFVRVVVAAFFSRLDPTVEELEDVKTAVSEAVTNAVIHGYRDKPGIVEIQCTITGRETSTVIQDWGIGIADVPKAMEPLYTGRPDLERSGMGFSFMEAFMDTVTVESAPGKGTKVILGKLFPEVASGWRQAAASASERV